MCLASVSLCVKTVPQILQITLLMWVAMCLEQLVRERYDFMHTPQMNFPLRCLIGAVFNVCWWIRVGTSWFMGSPVKYFDCVNCEAHILLLKVCLMRIVYTIVLKFLEHTKTTCRLFFLFVFDITLKWRLNFVLRFWKHAYLSNILPHPSLYTN